MSKLIEHIITDTIIITIILNSITDKIYFICFCGVTSIYLINKYI
jgi:hypothetical protein